MTGPGRERLGKGLGALLGEYADDASGGAVDGLSMVSVGAIRPNPFQPRQEFDPAELDELKRSIEENGLLQPLVVRRRAGTDDAYELVAGERRLRSVSLLGWTEVPVLVRDVDDQALLVLALVENLQREGLSPLEEAEGYRTLQETFGLTQKEIARAVGRERSTVANTLRLLSLPPSVRTYLAEGKLSAGHARALVTVDDPLRAGELARKAVSGDWSVREMEERAKRARKTRSNVRSSRADPQLAHLERLLEDALSTRVTVRRQRGGKGTIEIPFNGDEELERLFEIITGLDASEVLG
jgi:ParB family chromosome partitioning protein